MAYIWQNPNWPSYTYDSEAVENAYSAFLEKKTIATSAFSILDPEIIKLFQVRAVAEEIVSSLAIEGEFIQFNSVYSSVSNHLKQDLLLKAKPDAYAEMVSSVVLDAKENHEPLTRERLNNWNKNFLQNRGGSYRTKEEYIIKQTFRGPEVVYTAVPPQRVEKEMEKLLSFINEKNEENLLVKSAIASQYFVVIHPYADGNGRVSRAIADYILNLSENSALSFLNTSSLILANRKEYYEKLNSISNQSESLDLTDWIVWNINLAARAYEGAVNALKKTLHVTKFINSLNPSEYNSRELFMLNKLADGSFFGKLTKDKWAKMTKCSSAAAQRDIRHLVDCGLLVPDGDKGPKTGYLFNSETL